MPNKKISDMDSAAALDGTELVELVQDGTNVKATAQDIADLAAVPAGVPRVYKMRITYDMPNLTTGVTIYTPQVGDILVAAAPAITTPWDGSSPFGGLYTGSVPAAPPYGFLYDGGGWDMTEDGVVGTAIILRTVAASEFAGIQFDSTDPLMFFVGAGSTPGDDPGASQGAADIYVVIVTPVAP